MSFSWVPCLWTVRERGSGTGTIRNGGSSGGGRKYDAERTGPFRWERNGMNQCLLIYKISSRVRCTLAARFVRPDLVARVCACVREVRQDSMISADFNQVSDELINSLVTGSVVFRLLSCILIHFLFYVFHSIIVWFLCLLHINPFLYLTVVNLLAL